MNVGQILTYAQIGISVALGGVILLQQKGTGLSSTFGGGGGSGFYQSKRGVEKGLLVATIVLGALFIVVGILTITVSPTVESINPGVVSGTEHTAPAIPTPQAVPNAVPIEELSE